ncbi:hypothetical protein FJU08_01300 [Martelella alba]|uniref:Uncharacterized protein n=1 Tax=Martelella alba TaxID=2590451 RepID=A0A506UIT0_9HYPH|nr:hypothetical protein [Martelella alba]TPW33229.1 hypothetical protein FJU08_01300 [Martelella alba]
MADILHLSAKLVRLLGRIRKAEAVMRMAADSDNAIRIGKGFSYFTLPDGRHVNADDVQRFIDDGFLIEVQDGLFNRGGQTLKVAEPLPTFTTGRRRREK